MIEKKRPIVPTALLVIALIFLPIFSLYEALKSDAKKLLN